LHFTNQNGIVGSFNSTTGVLTLSGFSSPANYSTALQSVVYENTSSNPNTASRQLRFVVTDGVQSSSPINSSVNVIAVNQGPTATGLSDVNVHEDAPATGIDLAATVN